MFKHGLVRQPGWSLKAGITSANLGKPVYEKALEQHTQYIRALESCGLQVTVLPAVEEYPDSVFVEDTAVLTEKCAVITQPGALSRRGEEIPIREALRGFYTDIAAITLPGTLDGGDVMRVDDCFYVGLSARTNRAGAGQFAGILSGYGFRVITVQMEKFLHLKTGLSYLENNQLLISGEFIGRPEFDKFRHIKVDEAEGYAANSIWVNDMVLVPAGFPRTRAAITACGYRTLEVDVSEFRKLDGGLSCLSLRF